MHSTHLCVTEGVKLPIVLSIVTSWQLPVCLNTQKQLKHVCLVMNWNNSHLHCHTCWLY